MGSKLGHNYSIVNCISIPCPVLMLHEFVLGTCSIISARFLLIIM
jgi:hypothetical protein